jgi:hypothetical protein
MNMNVVDNFLIFLESNRTQEYGFVCRKYDQNTELDKDKSGQDEMT